MAADSLKIFDILTSLGKHIYVSEVYVDFFIYWKTRSAKAVPKHIWVQDGNWKVEAI